MDAAKSFDYNFPGMYEVEYKLRAPHSDLRKRLDELGATHVRTWIQRDVYLNHPTRDFAVTDEAFRLRRRRTVDEEHWRAMITYKGPQLEGDDQTREELETEIGDFEIALNVFRHLGFDQVETVEKRRTMFSLEDAVICLDTVDGLGEYVEIELPPSTASLEARRDRATEILGLLGLDPDQALSTSYLELILESRQTK